MALKKAGKKAHTASAKAKRKKSIKVGKRIGKQAKVPRGQRVQGGARR